MKSLIALIFGFMFSILSFSANANLPVLDFSAIVQRALNFIEETAYLSTQAEDLDREVQSLKDFNWNDGDASNQLSTLTGYLQQSGNLASNAASVNSEFSTNLPGYSQPQGTDYNGQYAKITNDANTALKSVMQVMANINSQSDPMNQNVKLSKIQMQVSSAPGTLQATQGLAQITGQLASNMEVLQKTIAAQASAQEAYYAVQLQKEASNQAGFNNMMTNGSTETMAYGASGHSINVHDF